MTDGPDPLHSKGIGLFLVLGAAAVALVGCGGAWLAFALAVNYIATTVSSAGAYWQ